MNEQTSSILDTDLNDVSTRDPVLAKGRYNFELVKLEEATNKAGTGQMLKYQIKLLDGATSITGEPIPPGRRVFGQMVITPTEKLPADAIKRTLKKFMLCFGVDNGRIAPLDQWIGKQGVAVIGPSKTSDEYPDPKDEVKSFEPAK